MPGNQNFSGKSKWIAGGPIRSRQNDGRYMQHRRPSQAGSTISPWESGIAPGATSSSNFIGEIQSLQNQCLLNRINMPTNLAGNNYDLSNKVRRLDGIGSFDQRDRGMLLSPLLGVAPRHFPQTSQRSNLQQRLGNTRSSRSSGSKQTGSGYYPSDSRRSDNTRRNSKQQSTRRSRSNRDNLTSARYTDKRPTDNNKDFDAPKSPLKNESTEPNVEKEENLASNEKVLKDEKKDECPAEALYCHICDLKTFKTRMGYIRHLQGLTHSRMASSFHRKHATTIEYLESSASLAIMRQKDKQIRTSDYKGKPLPPVGRIIENVLLRKYMGTCCGKKFECPFDIHEHKLSVHHLKLMNKQKLDRDTLEHNVLDSVKENEIDDLIKSAKAAITESPLTIDNIPTYDDKMLFGEQYIVKREQYKCDICGGDTFTNLQEHCQSAKHYDNIVYIINEEEEIKTVEANMEIVEKNEKEAKDEKERCTQKYERHSKEDDCESNFSDKKEDSKTCESYEECMKDDEMVILDEDEYRNEDTLSEEPKSILDDMADESVIEDKTSQLGITNMTEESVIENQTTEPGMMNTTEELVIMNTTEESVMKDITDEPVIDADMQAVGEDLIL